MPLEVLANMGLAYMSAICFRSFRAMSTSTKLRRWWGVAVVHLARLHGQRMHTKPAMKRWFVAADETASQFGWTTAKVPPDARISDWMVVVKNTRSERLSATEGRTLHPVRPSSCSIQMFSMRIFLRNHSCDKKQIFLTNF